MNTQNPERHPLLESYIGTLQWRTKFFGPKGAVKVGKKYFSKFLFNQDTQTRLWATLSMASLYYSASAFSWKTMREIKAVSKFNLIGMIQSAITAYCLLMKAWQYVQKAKCIIHSADAGTLHVSADNYDVIQSIARAYYRTLVWNKPHGFTAKIVLGLVESSIQLGLASPDCTNITKCFLHIGRVDLMFLQIEPSNEGKMHIAIFDSLLEVWSFAKEAAKEKPDLQMFRQLSRVYRHIMEQSKRLIRYKKELMIKDHQGFPSSASNMYDQASVLLDEYLQLIKRSKPVV
jgi:hypothetical protein